MNRLTFYGAVYDIHGTSLGEQLNGGFWYMTVGWFDDHALIQTDLLLRAQEIA